MAHLGNWLVSLLCIVTFVHHTQGQSLTFPVQHTITSPQYGGNQDICGLQAGTGVWEVKGGVLQATDTQMLGYEAIVVIRTTAEICRIDLTKCGAQSAEEPCYCESKVPQGDVKFYSFSIRQPARMEQSQKLLRASLYAKAGAAGRGSNDHTYNIGRLPTVFEPVQAYFTVNGQNRQALVSGQRFTLVSESSRPSVGFCAEGILQAYTLTVEINGQKTTRKDGCVEVRGSNTFDWSTQSAYDVTFSYTEMDGCRRTGSFSGQARPSSSSSSSSSVSIQSHQEEFPNLEVTYAVMLSVMGVVFSVCVLVGVCWYSRKAREIKMNREHELQGALDFDSKFESNGMNTPTLGFATGHTTHSPIEVGGSHI